MYVTHGLAFYHMPRTGGTWTRAVLEQAGLRLQVGGHPTPLMVRNTEPDGMELTAATMRHPLTWWRSIWAHALRKRNTNMKPPVTWWNRCPWPVILELVRPDFDEFCRAVLDRIPGIYSVMASRFMRVDYICRFEHLENDLRQLGILAGLELTFDAPPQKPTGSVATMRRETADRLLEAERGIVLARGYDWIPEGVVE